MEQGSGEWFAARLGKATASRIGDILAERKDGKPKLERETYLGELVAERLSGCVYDHPTNPAMQWGIDTEPYAREHYSVNQNVLVEQVGFVPHPTISASGGSPDGLVGDDGLVEFKCPNTHTHIKTWRTREIPDKYYAQMQWCMACTDRVWCDFVSYDPRIGHPPLVMYVHRVDRDDAWLRGAEEKVRAFLAEVDAIVAELLEAA